MRCSIYRYLTLELVIDYYLIQLSGEEVRKVHRFVMQRSECLPARDTTGTWIIEGKRNERAIKNETGNGEEATIGPGVNSHEIRGTGWRKKREREKMLLLQVMSANTTLTTNEKSMKETASTLLL